MKFNFKNIIILVVVIGVVLLALSFISSMNKEEEKLVYSDIIESFDNDLVESFVIDGEYNMTIVLYET